MHGVCRPRWSRHKPFRHTRAGSRALCWFAVIGLLLSLQGAVVIAKPHRDRGRDDGYRLVEARDAVPRHRRGGVHGEIVGGTIVPQGTYPFATFIFADFGGGSGQVCTGSLIAPQFVLTAGHCVVDEATGTPITPSQFTLVVGLSRAFSPPAPEANTFSVEQVFRHPDFAFPTNDVAVLKLSRSVPASIAQPIAVVAANDTRFDSPGQSAIAAGWGLTVGGGDVSPDLRQIGTTTISDAACDAAFSGPEIDDVSIFCTQVPSKNTCQGDSGGPLFVDQAGGTSVSRHNPRAKDDDGVQGERKKRHKKKRRNPPPPPPPPPPPATNALLIGVTSFGAENCAPGTPNGFAQLSAPVIHDFVTNALKN